MKKLIFSTAIIAMVLAVQAQEIPERKSEKPMMHQKNRGHRPMHGMDMKQLNLTDAQKEQFKTQKESFRKQMEELKKNDNITVKEWRGKAEALRKQHKEQTQSILTKEQKSQLEKMKEEGKAKREALGKERAEKMKTTLGLSDEQSAKMQTNRVKTGEKMKAIREDKSLSDDQKKENMKELHKEQKEFMKSVLTEEQLNKMKELRHNKQNGEKRKPEMKQTI
jgi:Spy/CpxP family protein refolding chaperone